MGNEQQRHDMSKDNRQFINGVFWILRTGAPWWDLPPCYGKWGTVYQRFRRSRDKGMWEKLLEILVDEPDFEWLMIDASHCKVHPHAAGGQRRQSRHEPNKRGLNTKLHLAVDANGMPVRILITEGTRADCEETVHLIEGISAGALLADRGYDTDEIIAYVTAAGIEVVIPSKRSRK